MRTDKILALSLSLSLSLSFLVNYLENCEIQGTALLDIKLVGVFLKHFRNIRQ
jgi:hypothetical protein